MRQQLEAELVIHKSNLTRHCLLTDFLAIQQVEISFVRKVEQCSKVEIFPFYLCW